MSPRTEFRNRSAPGTRRKIYEFFGLAFSAGQRYSVGFNPFSPTPVPEGVFKVSTDNEYTAPQQPGLPTYNSGIDSDLQFTDLTAIFRLSP